MRNEIILCNNKQISPMNKYHSIIHIMKNLVYDMFVPLSTIISQLNFPNLHTFTIAIVGALQRVLYRGDSIVDSPK